MFLLCRVFALPGFGNIKAFLDRRKKKKRSNFNDLKFVVFCFGCFALGILLRVFRFGHFASAILPKAFLPHMENLKIGGIALGLSLCDSPIPPITANYFCIRIPSRISTGEYLSWVVPSPS